MGFLRDIEDMPNQFDYSRQFFDRWYRPEHTIVCVVGDVERQATRALVEKYFGGWKRGSYKADVPAEPPQGGPKTAHVDWPAPTLPLVAVAFKAPAYDDEIKDSAALDVALYHAFSENSDLYRKLVIEEQKVDALNPDNADHVDPYLFTVTARVKEAKDVEYVRDQVLAAFESLREKLIPAENLEEVKSNLRYEFALSLNSTAAAARVLAHYVALRRTPETINRRYALYRAIGPQDVQAAARKHFVTEARTIATLAHKP
jgi:zinc protease